MAGSTEPILERYAERHPWFAERYLTLDARVLGVARFYLGALLLSDLLRRVPDLRTFYSNEGLLPNHLVLWHPSTNYSFSLFLLASRPEESALLFVALGVVFFLFAIGYRTRFFHLVSFIGIVSLHGRLVLFDDGSETTTRLLTFWTLFLPMGRRYSVDALRNAPAREGDRVVSLAVPATLLQLALIYVFNAVHKDGATWSSGTAVHYVLHQDRIVTRLGMVVRAHLSLPWSRALTWGALGTEAALPILLLSPVWTRGCRRLAVLLGILLHVGFAALLNLGMFSFNMIGFFLLFIPGADLTALSRTSLGRALGGVGKELVGRFGVRTAENADAPIRARVREVLVVCFSVALGGQMLLENRAVPAALKPARLPWLLERMVEYPRLHEGWSMFAPDAPLTDLYVAVDATTVDGRHVDPLNELASRVAPAPAERIPEFLDQRDSFCDYTAGIVGREDYHGVFREWLFAHPERTGHGEDALTEFDVLVLEDRSPPPGGTVADHTTVRTLFHAERH